MVNAQRSQFLIAPKLDKPVSYPPAPIITTYASQSAVKSIHKSSFAPTDGTSGKDFAVPNPRSRKSQKNLQKLPQKSKQKELRRKLRASSLQKRLQHTPQIRFQRTNLILTIMELLMILYRLMMNLIIHSRVVSISGRLNQIIPKI